VKKKAKAVCEWFLKCGRPATGATPHPILISVPTCDRCHEFVTEEKKRTNKTCIGFARGCTCKTCADGEEAMKLRSELFRAEQVVLARRHEALEGVQR